MSVGKLKTPLTILQPVLSPDGGGGFTLAWDEVADVFVEIAALAGNESLEQRQMTASAPCRITLLYRDDMDTAMRLADGGKHYEIVSLRDPDGSRIYLEIIAKAV